MSPVCNKTPEYWVQFLPDLNPQQGRFNTPSFKHYIIINAANFIGTFQVRERMTYVGSVLEEFVELDEQVVPIKWNISKLTRDKSAMPVSTNQQIHHCHCGRKVQWANISWKRIKFEPKFQDLLIFGCVYSLDYLSFPILVLWKNFPIISVRHLSRNLKSRT